MSFKDEEADVDLVVVPGNGAHDPVTQGEIDAVVLGLMSIKGEHAAVCHHAAVLIAMLARHIHQARLTTPKVH